MQQPANLQGESPHPGVGGRRWFKSHGQGQPTCPAIRFNLLQNPAEIWRIQETTSLFISPNNSVNLFSSDFKTGRGFCNIMGLRRVCSARNLLPAFPTPLIKLKKGK